MSWTFDVESQSLYVRLSDEAIEGQIELDDGTIVDVDAEGNAVGVEVLRAWAQWDFRAVAERFELSEDAAKFLELLAVTVGNMAPPRQTVPNEMTELVQERPSSSANALDLALA
ncbi:MAG TPA: DUF2283 domain-containing protein [Acidimicrobiales bacterium]|nr:DUF2283 domain-containing protein [Acidimicrobiales bacterium]